MAKKHRHHDSPADQVIGAAMQLAAERGWRGLALADIAERAGMPLAELVAEFPDRGAILDAYVQRVDHHMLTGKAERGDSPRDRLFDAVMRRFDAMAADRRALGSILRHSGNDPLALLCGLRRFMRSMALTLEAAGISSAGLSGLVKTQALAAVYANTLRTFLADDSQDLGRTMAALDRALGRMEGLAGLVLQRGRRRPAEAGPAMSEG